MRRGHYRPDDRLRQRLPRILFATGLMTAALWLAAGLLARVGAGELVSLLVLLAVGGGVYLAAGEALGAFRLSEVRAMMRRRPRPAA